MRNHDENGHFLKNSDHASFTLNEQVNCRYWTTENPHWDGGVLHSASPKSERVGWHLWTLVNPLAIVI